MPTYRARSITIWIIAALGALTPVVAFALSLSAAERSQPSSGGLHRVSMILNAPGVFPGLMFRSWVVQIAASAIFWGILAGAAGAAAFLPWKDRHRAVRALTILAIPTFLYGALIAWMAAGWNPD